jgi:hypothetical protein
MTPLSEIADKMPTAAGTLLLAVSCALGCIGMSLQGRRIARVIFGLSLSIGGIYACALASESLLPGPMRDAIFAELGLRWVVIQLIAPLLPAAGSLAVRWRRS